jgi:hypothetical protein
MNLTPFEKFQQAFQKPAANSANALRAGLPAQDITTHADRIRVESPDATRQEYDPMIHPADWAACITPDSTAVPDGMLHAIVDLFELHVQCPSTASVIANTRTVTRSESNPLQPPWTGQ